MKPDYIAAGIFIGIGMGALWGVNGLPGWGIATFGFYMAYLNIYDN